MCNFFSINILQFNSSNRLNQLELQDNLILQGPPGTGKTFLIADICKLLLNENKSVLVTALTNRALMELAEKDHLKPFLSEGRIFKTKVSVDENRELPELVNTKTVSPIPGSLILSTFYISSGEASQIGGTPPFDYVILDESSQALLAMLAGSQQLGEKCLWIGDLKQMPAVVSLILPTIFPFFLTPLCIPSFHF
jgi:superfamily I DNA and/or RNA helicase